MGLRINEATGSEIYESKQYTGSRKGNTNTSGNQATSSGVIYEHETEPTPKSCVYTKEQILGTTASTENLQFQNNLKVLGFYSGSVATDGNLGSQESLRAIKNFQRVYGLPINGGSNEQTRAKLNEVITFYNSTLNDPDLSTVAQLVKNHSDYSEGVVKADVARTWTFLRVGMGLTAKQASGVMGNIMKESGASPTNANNQKMGSDKLRDTNYVYSVNDGISYGIIQWLDSRKQGLLDMAGTMGSSVSDWNVQFAYLRKEVETSYKSSWTKITGKDDIENAAKVFCKEIEVANWAENLDDNDRMKYANTVYGALA